MVTNSEAYHRSGRRRRSEPVYLSGARPPGTNQPWALVVNVHG